MNTAILAQSEKLLESRTLAEQAYESIKTDIIIGRLAQGSKIIESDLALKYGISRGPLREAIHRLLLTINTYLCIFVYIRHDLPKPRTIFILAH